VIAPLQSDKLKRSLTMTCDKSQLLPILEI
jgi:hypothetical protein